VTRRLLLAILLLAACNASAKGSPSNEQDNPLQVQTSPGDFGNEYEKPFGLVLILGAMVFPSL
jgi:outer membrane biogenesis lipoprotein LolB